MFLLCKATKYRRSLRRNDILEVKVGNDQEIISHLINEKSYTMYECFSSIQIDFKMKVPDPD